jgi:hypothetical protein
LIPLSTCTTLWALLLLAFDYALLMTALAGFSSFVMTLAITA